MASPSGYRKVLRLMKLADKFNLPIINLVDTPGAYPGISSEEKHIGKTIADLLKESFSFKVPNISVYYRRRRKWGCFGNGCFK